MAAADFNGDGRLDVVAFALNGSTGDAADSAIVLLGRGDGTFVWPYHYYGVGVSPATGIDTWDFNGDGRPDLEVAGYDYWDGSPVTTVLVNDGDWPSVVPNLRINDATVTEGNAGTVAATFTVTQPPGSTETITVDYATRDATATAGSDYQAASGTLTFAPGQTSKTITVLVNGDRVPEPNEVFYVDLSNPTNAAVFDGLGVGTIVDDERGISIIPAMSRSEGNTGQTPFAFAVTLSSASDAPVTVNWATADKTATAGSDYQAASGTLTFAPGEISKPITILVNGDLLPEANETFYVNLSGATNATIIYGGAAGTIVDDDPRFSIGGGGTVVEGNSGTKNVTFTVTLSAAYDVPVTVTYATADGEATSASGDYQAKTGTLTFNPGGPLTQNITVLVNGDRLPEATETFSVNLGGGGQRIATILDNEPRISISDVTKKEGKKGQTTQFTFTVTLSAAYDQAVTMSYRTVDGTAKTSDSDYVAKTGTLTFKPGETTKTITIEVKGDSKKEANETFSLELFAASGNALLADWLGLGTILNDD